MKFSNSLRKWSRIIHRDLSYLFSGMVIIYAISGIVMNHRDTINPHYSIEKIEMAAGCDLSEDSSAEELMPLLKRVGEDKNYTQHYSPDGGGIKVFLKGGSNLYIDTKSDSVLYEKVSSRVLIGAMAKLHYNPGRWWTIFADIFAISLIVITLTGVIMVRGKKGLWGRGGIELLVGILIPILFFFI